MIVVNTSVEVTFFHPDIGTEKQIYSFLSPTDLATWKANEKLSAVITTSIKEKDFSESTPELLQKMQKAKIESEIIFN